MFAFVRAVTYATLFVGFVLVYLPGRVLRQAGVQAPGDIGLAQAAGLLLTAAGAALAVTCVLTFALIGHGTPAPFDPPRRLVMRGLYAWVRNPMYLGAWLVLGGAALYYQSLALALFWLTFVATTILFVHLHEEPALRRQFGAEYEAYCAGVHRWWPRPPAGV